MTGEIGSEFWLETSPASFEIDRDGVYVLSGRTAIDMIIRNILMTNTIRNVYMPAYCCQSMVDPFISANIDVLLYDMSYDGSLHYEIDTDINVDILYVSNYFGYDNTLDESIIRCFRQKGSIIIYDRTHSFLMSDDGLVSDYSFASIRKWMAVICGAEVKGVGRVGLNDCPYLSVREKAMVDKRNYLNGDSSIKKEAFLREYRQFSHLLDSDYSGYRMDDKSYSIFKRSNIDEMKSTRRRNAGYLHKNLALRFIGELTDCCCPLFVPVFLESRETRDYVCKSLISSGIYCPVHWPKNSLVTPDMKVNSIFDTELSLICDQRYNIEHMHRLVTTLKNFI